MTFARLVAGMLFLFLSAVAVAKGPAYTDPAKTDADFLFQGEYAGTLKTNDGDQKFGLQVIAVGGGKFHAVGYHGGLPGDGWGQGEKHEADGELADGVVTIKGNEASASIKDGVATIRNGDGNVLGEMKKVDRKSP